MDLFNMSLEIRTIADLFISLVEHLGLVCAATFLLLSSKRLRRVISRTLTNKDKLILIIFFGALGIFATYDGTPIKGVIANLRTTSMIVAGLLGGPVVGFGTGLVAGGHRFLIDIHGITSLQCGISTFAVGAIAGLVSQWLKRGGLNWKVAAGLAFIGESINAGLVLATIRPFETALEIIKVVVPPMIVLNSIGAALLIETIKRVISTREKRASIQARKAMAIASQTVIHLREGLNEFSALATANIILEHTRVVGVAITSTDKLLAYAGKMENLFTPGQPLKTKTTRMVLENKEATYINQDAEVGKEVPHRMFQSVIAVPLSQSGHAVGTLKFYGDEKNPLNPIDLEIANGLAKLFSIQLDLQEIQIKNQLLDRAEIKRLQAQINPHFLFNSLNTIASLCRTNSNTARKLITELANYLRRNIKDTRQFITLEDELNQVKSYLSIEHARFSDRISYEIDIHPEVKKWSIPPLIIQPLVENSIKHGLTVKSDGGKVWIKATQRKSYLHISVRDNGIGISQTAVEHIFAKENHESVNSSMGLRNVNQRLEHLYGPSSRLKISRLKGQGTIIEIKVPVSSQVRNLTA